MGRQWLYTYSLVIIIVVGMASRVLGAQDAAQSFTLDGRLYSTASATTPLLDAAINLRIQILNPAETCILYEEVQQVDTTTSDGNFNLLVGSPTVGADSAKRGANDVGNSMAQVFTNTAGNISGKLVSNGNNCTYTPTGGDVRYLRVVFTPSVDNIDRTLTPNMVINSVPNSLVAERCENLQGYEPTDFLELGTVAGLTQANVESLFSTTNFNRLTDLVSVPTASYVQSDTNGAANLPTINGDATAPTAGQFWFDSGSSALKFFNGSTVVTVGNSTGGAAGGDLSGTYPNPVVAKIQGFGVSTTDPTADGQTLKFDGTS